jgi:hypothetical protein
MDISKDIVVTGDLGREPVLNVWDSANMVSLFNF